MSGWPAIPFGELATVMANGLSPSSKGRYGADVLTLSAVTRGRFDAAFSKTALLDKEPGPEQVVRDSTFLVCRGNGNIGLVGAGVFGEDVGHQLVFPDTIIGCQVDLTRVHRPFLQAVWRSPAVRSQIEAGARTTNGTFKINQKVLSAITVPLPALPEQKRIAAILDKADEIRRKRQETIRLTEELLRSTFLEMFGDPVTNPKGWEVRRLGDVIAETQYGTAAKANTDGIGLPILRMNNITYGGEWDLREVKWCLIDSSEMEKYTTRRGDLLFNRTNSPELVGKTAVWDSDDVYAVAGYLIRVRFTAEATPHYVSGLLNSRAGKRLLFEKAKPSNNMSNISASELKRLEIPVPPVKQQRRFAGFAVKIRAAASRRDASLRTAEQLGSALTGDVFRSGKVA